MHPIIFPTLKGFECWLRRQNSLIFAISLTLISIVVCQLILAPFDLGLIEDLEFYPTPMEIENHWGVKLLMAVIFAPLFETLIFQLFPFWVMSKFGFFRQHRWLMVLVAGLLFGSQHYYSLSYIIATMFMGSVLMYGYIIKWEKFAYWNVVLFHAFWNLVMLSYNWLWG